MTQHKLTDPQRKLLTILAQHGPMRPTAVARMMWPDSKGWERRSHRHNGNQAGALGATMNMKAATILWRLHDHGLTWVEGDYNTIWSISPKGRRVLDA